LLRFKQKYRFWGTSLEGTRQVFTYTEILTDDIIEEYVNDELIDSRPNPLGQIPVVHIANIPVSGSPWGLSDAHDIITLNRSYNEISTDIADIINYHAAPVTVIVGAKASNLEKGAKKVWGGLPKDAQVFNLEGGGAGIQGALQYLETLKRSMHELMNIPETALGQSQPVSNTSGVALQVQYQPLMNRWAQKSAQYGSGIETINELVLLNLAIKEPQMFQWNPDVDGPLEEGQAEVLDVNDPMTFITYTHFPEPLPLDKIVLLNELAQKISMGLESKAGALRALGEEFPLEKLNEIRKESQDDAMSEGALNLVKVQVQKQIMDMTGFMAGPDGTATPIDPMMMGDGDVMGDGQLGPQGSDPEAGAVEQDNLMAQSKVRDTLIEEAFGDNPPPMRPVDKD
jgi:hypothetical protein